MDLLLPEDLEELVKVEQHACVSMYMPTHRIWNEVPEDPIRLRNLIREAERKLVENGTRPTEARAMLGPVRALADDDSFWRVQCDGLALFLTPESIRIFRLPISFDELAVVHERFHVKPLLSLFAADIRFYVLALNLEKVRLLAGTQFKLTEVDLPDVPKGLKESLAFDDFEPHQQFHSGGGQSTGGGQRTAIFHGQGDAADSATMKKRMAEFFRRVDNGVCDALKSERAPLVLAGVDHLRGIYREVNHYKYLADSSVTVNPDELSLRELHNRVWSVADRYFRKNRETALYNFEYLATTEPARASDRFDIVVPAAFFKRVDVLFARGDKNSWGTYDDQLDAIEIHERPQPGDQDLIDFAVAHTLRNAGTVYIESADSIPGQSEVAAIFRY
jgi:hypothetical protein